MRYQQESVDEILKAITYNADNGTLSWKGSDAVLGSTNCGYKRFSFKGQKYYVHRLIYAIEFGSVPPDMIVDHIDGDRSNNHISNLRLCCPQQNATNRHVKPPHNSSGWPWVRKPINGIYRYYMTHRGKSYSKYGFTDAVSAYAAGRKRCIELNGIHTPSLDHLTHEQLLEYASLLEAETIKS